MAKYIINVEELRSNFENAYSLYATMLSDDEEGMYQMDTYKTALQKLEKFADDVELTFPNSSLDNIANELRSMKPEFDLRAERRQKEVLSAEKQSVMREETKQKLKGCGNIQSPKRRPQS